MVGGQTWQALERFIQYLETIPGPESFVAPLERSVSVPSVPNSRSYPILWQGDGLVSPNLQLDVKLLQLLLQQRGFGAVIDGFFGAGTDADLRAFQTQAGFTADGIAGQQTWTGLLGQWVAVYEPSRPLTAYGDRLIASVTDATTRSYAQRSIPLILQECQRVGVTDLGQIAYIFATARHESRLGQWMIEFASGTAYEGRLDLGNTQPGDGVRYKGRGFVQITGRLNYTRWSDRMGIDLLTYPDRTADYNVAATILVLGMRDGSFTGYKLDDYILGDRRDFVGARRIINGMDRAAQISTYAENFLRNMS
jgi:peptidoglycan hydrolase-like protein with peptidoglycan-binding domain